MMGGQYFLGKPTIRGLLFASEVVAIIPVERV